jgi:hypothetical protein
MPDEITPQFFTPDASGDSQSVYKTIIDNLEALQTSEIVARNRQYKVTPASTVALDGIPGIPFERSMPNPDLFYQGEDIVYDVFLFHDGASVSSDDFEVQVSVKTSPRASTVSWEGSLDNGIYPAPNQSGRYELWIPSNVSSMFVAGTYYLNIQIRERVGAGKGRFDRKYVLLQSYFNIDYSNFSTKVENATTPQRVNMEPTWPNSPNTIGRPMHVDDEVFYSLD